MTKSTHGFFFFLQNQCYVSGQTKHGNSIGSTQEHRECYQGYLSASISSYLFIPLEREFEEKFRPPGIFDVYKVAAYTCSREVFYYD